MLLRLGLVFSVVNVGNAAYRKSLARALVVRSPYMLINTLLWLVF